MVSHGQHIPNDSKENKATLAPRYGCVSMVSINTNNQKLMTSYEGGIFTSASDWWIWGTNICTSDFISLWTNETASALKPRPLVNCFPLLVVLSQFICLLPAEQLLWSKLSYLYRSRFQFYHRLINQDLICANLRIQLRGINKGRPSLPRVSAMRDRPEANPLHFRTPESEMNH